MRDYRRYLLVAHQGLALRRMERQEEALAQLLLAERISAGRAQATANVAVALLDCERAADAEARAQRVLRTDAHNATALSILITGCLAAGQGDAARNYVGQLKDAKERLRANAEIAGMERGVDARVRGYVRLLRLDRNPTYLIEMARALVGINPESRTSRDFVPWVTGGVERRKNGERALKYLQEAERKLRAIRSQDLLANCLVLRAIVNGYIGRGRADAEIHEALAIAPGNPSVARKCAQYWIERGEGSNALSVLQSYSGQEKVLRGWAGLKARALLMADRTKELGRFCRSRRAIDELGSSEAAALRAAGLVRTGEYAEALGVIRNAPEQGRSAQFAITHASALAGLDDMASAEAVLLEAETSGPTSEAWRIRLVRAQNYAQERRWSEAIALYEEVYAPTALLEIVSSYLLCLYNADRVGSCVARGREVVAIQGMRPELWIVATAVLELCDFSEAEDLCRRGIAAGEGDAHLMVLLAEAMFKQGQKGRARGSMPSPFDAARLPTQTAERTTELYLLLGEPEAALETAFYFLERHPDARDAQMLMVKIVLNVEGLFPSVLHPILVGPGTSATLTRAGQQVRVRILPSDARKAVKLDVLPRSANGRALLGCSVGSRARVSLQGRRAVWEVGAVDSLYPERMQLALAEITRQSSGDGEIEAVPLEQAIPRLRAEGESRERARADISAFYDANVPPLGTIGARIGRNSYEVWYGVIAGQLGSLVEVSRRQPSEEPELRAIAAASSACVLDATSILALVEWDCLEALPEGRWEWLIAASTIGELEEGILRRRDAANRDSGDVVVQGGQLQFHPIERTTAMRAQKVVEHAVRWARMYCNLVPLPVAGSDGRRGAIATIGMSSVDSMAIAAARNATLVSEDLGLRRLARQLGQVRGSMALSILDVAGAEGLIGASIATRARAKALGWKYVHLEIAPGLTSVAIQTDGGRVGPMTLGVTRYFARPHVRDETAEEVAVDAALAIQNAIEDSQMEGLHSVKQAIEARHNGVALWHRVRERLISNPGLREPLRAFLGNSPHD